MKSRAALVDVKNKAIVVFGAGRAPSRRRGRSP
jgi:hypothetical protein